MAVVREFYVRETGGESESFALARDVITDRVFVVHGKGRMQPELSYYEDHITLRDFLHIDGPAQQALLDLIGSLVVED